MKNYSSIIIAVFILFTSCQKDEDQSFTEVSGVVYEKGSNNSKTVANALVQFQWRRAKTYGAEIYFLDSTRTDQNGRFTVKADTPAEDLHIFASAYRHFPGGELTMMPNVQRGKTQNIDIQIIPYSWVKMNIKKTLGYDYIGISPLVGGGINGMTTMTNDTIYSRALGNQEVQINCFRFTNNAQVAFQHSVRTIGHDTVEVIIKF